MLVGDIHSLCCSLKVIVITYYIRIVVFFKCVIKERPGCFGKQKIIHYTFCFITWLFQVLYVFQNLTVTVSLSHIFLNFLNIFLNRKIYRCPSNRHRAYRDKPYPWTDRSWKNFNYFNRLSSFNCIDFYYNVRNIQISTDVFFECYRASPL